MGSDDLIAVDSGKFGCFESTTSDDVTLTYRPGSPGAAGGSWEPFPTDETVLSGEMVVVATTTQPDGTFTIEVTHVSDDGECEDEAETSDEPETPDLPCMVECGPSSYCEFFDSLAGWFQDMVESMAPDTDESEAGGWLRSGSCSWQLVMTRFSELGPCAKRTDSEPCV